MQHVMDNSLVVDKLRISTHLPDYPGPYCWEHFNYPLDGWLVFIRVE